MRAMNDLFLLEPEYRYHAERTRGGAQAGAVPPVAPSPRSGTGPTRPPTRRTGSTEMSMSVVHDKMDHMTSALVGRDAELEQLCSTLGISASGRHRPTALGRPPRRRRRRRQDPPADRAPRPRRRRGLAGPGRPLPRLRRQRPPLPPLLRDHRPHLPRAARHSSTRSPSATPPCSGCCPASGC